MFSQKRGRKKLAGEHASKGYVIYNSSWLALIEVYIKLWERRSKVVRADEEDAWRTLCPAAMSEEECEDDGRITRRRPSWRSDKLNEWMDDLDAKGNEKWRMARKERNLGTPLELPAPSSVQPWMHK